MGRQIINDIECCKCHKQFDVATEDIEWERLNDMGVCEVAPKTKQEGLLQKVTCPYCGKKNNIAYEQRTLLNGKVVFSEVKSLEP